MLSSYMESAPAKESRVTMIGCQSDIEGEMMAIINKFVVGSPSN